MPKPKPRQQKIKTALYLDQDQVEALKKLQNKFPDVPMSVHVRRALRLYLERMDEFVAKMPKQPGAED